MNSAGPDREVDIAVVGAGAAGLMCAIWAARTRRARGLPPSVLALDGARTLGAKILVAGGGRCNVTHYAVDETNFAGSTRPAIRKVLGRFTVGQTVAFFSELGVELKREESGKLFPVTDSARTVLHALLGAAAEAGASVEHPWRVDRIARGSSGVFTIQSGDREVKSRRLVLATGGKALPRSGSDGAGYAFAREMRHSITDRVFPALVPLLLPDGHPLRAISGVSAPATLSVRSGDGRALVSFTNSTLCTHFGLSGPSVLDISRYLIDAMARDGGAHLCINWLPGLTPESVDEELRAIGRSTVHRYLADRLPSRLASAIVEVAGVDGSTTGGALTRESRRAVAAGATEMIVPVVGDRGFGHAEATAGGVPLSEIRLDTMESRVCPGLHFCGEICDVDGRVGGFNFQWAWSSGYVAGCGAGGA